MNTAIFYFLNNLAENNSDWSAVIIFLATTFSTLVIVAAVVFLLIHKDKFSAGANAWIVFRRRISETALVFFSAGAAWVLAKALQYVFHQPRPFLVLDNVRLLFDHGGYDSFPSGHATFFAALATAIYFRHRPTGILFWLAALAIGLARVIAGVHFPADILAGFILGALVPLLWSRLFRSPKI